MLVNLGEMSDLNLEMSLDVVYKQLSPWDKLQGVPLIFPYTVPSNSLAFKGHGSS